MEKIKCIVKRPDEEYGHMTWISNTLENLQQTVGGLIEVTRLPNDCLIICNEEGKIYGLPHNFNIKYILASTEESLYEQIVGTVIICGTNEEQPDEFGDIPIDFNEWKSLLCEWGN